MPARVAPEHRPPGILLSAALLLLFEPALAQAARGPVPYDPARYLRARELASAGNLAGAATETEALLAPLPRDLASLELAATCDPTVARDALEAVRWLHPVLVLPDAGAGSGCVRLLFGLYDDESSVRGIVPLLPPGSVPDGARTIRLHRDAEGAWTVAEGEPVAPEEVGRNRAARMAPAESFQPEAAQEATREPPTPLEPETRPLPVEQQEPVREQRPAPQLPSRPAQPERATPEPVEPVAPVPPLDVERIYEAQVEFQRGRQALLGRDMEGADAAFHKVVAIDPTNAPAWNNIGTIALLQKDYAEAVKAFTEALRIDPRYARAHLNLATGLYGIGKTDEALAELQLAEELEPRSFDVHFNGAALLAEQGRFNEALDSLETALDINPSDPKALELKRVILEEMERRSLVRHPKKPEGIARERPAGSDLHVVPEDTPSWTPPAPAPEEPPRGTVAGTPEPAPAPPGSSMAEPPSSRSGTAPTPAAPAPLLRPASPPRAAAGSRTGATSVRTEADTQFERGKRFYDRGDYRAAAAEFEKAREIDPGNANIHNNLGVVYLMQERYPSAIEEFRRTLDLDPGNIRARINLGGAFYNLGQIDDAIAALEEAERLAPQDPDVAYNLALFYSGADRREDARRAIQHAVGLDPFDPRIRALQAALPGTPETAYITEPTVFVRDGPGRAFRILSRAHHGDPVLVLQKRADWWKVRTLDGLEGWIASALLALGEAGR